MTGDRELKISTPSAVTVRFEREFNAPSDMVFKAFTTPELVKQWLTGPKGWTMTLCEIDLRVGGQQRFEMRRQSGAVMRWGGTFRQIVPDSQLVHTEFFEDDWTGGETLVTNDFIARGDQTDFVQTILFSSPEARDRALASAMEVGMEISFGHLDALLGSSAV